ncbi:hypothetical protein HMPREF1979_01582 [Actinomyces johnsonii F0542]|uniref:Uncharacterized protein n=1 Tax=Actinomyces johnsonii F0542 TaxID=1321818 RepID=U1QPI5_9ACTO|nr:hypothetical protein HMPREF1979_01582 [Actinomyces johnsonii F0542]
MWAQEEYSSACAPLPDACGRRARDMMRCCRTRKRVHAGEMLSVGLRRS